MRPIGREIFAWWEEPTTGRVVWRYIGWDSGGLSVTLHGLQKMLVLSANNYGMLMGVVSLMKSLVHLLNRKK